MSVRQLLTTWTGLFAKRSAEDLLLGLLEALYQESQKAAQPTWQDLVLCVGLVSCQNSLQRALES